MVAGDFKAEAQDVLDQLFASGRIESQVTITSIRQVAPNYFELLCGERWPCFKIHKVTGRSFKESVREVSVRGLNEMKEREAKTKAEYNWPDEDFHDHGTEHKD